MNSFKNPWPKLILQGSHGKCHTKRLLHWKLHVILTLGRGKDGGGNTGHTRRWRANCDRRPAVAVCCLPRWAIFTVAKHPHPLTTGCEPILPKLHGIRSKDPSDCEKNSSFTVFNSIRLLTSLNYLWIWSYPPSICWDSLYPDTNQGHFRQWNFLSAEFNSISWLFWLK